MSIYAQFSTRRTPQSEQAHSKQQQNNAGGYAFVVDDWARLHRFLILGSEGGTYYVKERPLTIDSAKCVRRCLDADPTRTVNAIAEVSSAGRAPKNSPAIFALAIAAGHANPVARAAALGAIPSVCRTGTHLFEFVSCVQNFRGWGRSLRRAVGAWYTSQQADDLAYQLVKYQQRGGWSHRDVLRKCHVADKAPQGVEAAIRWAVAGDGGMGERKIVRGEIEETQPALRRYLPHVIKGYERARGCSAAEAVTLIREYQLTREMLPTEVLTDPAVWDALLVDMPMTAMIRNLGKMTSVGLLQPMTAASQIVCARLRDSVRLQKARVHPMSVLAALKVYQQGHGIKGSLKWSPVPAIVDALDAAFYLSFGAVTPTNKRTMLALDVSGSMSAPVAGIDFLHCREATAALALVTANVEPQHMLLGFSHALVDLGISPRQRMDDVLRLLSVLSFGRTDCALPMLHAARNKLPIDTFVVLTDNETWCGDIHPHQALEAYRQKSGLDAKLAVVAMTASQFSIANPEDPGMLDVVGFDVATPNVLAEFALQ